MLARPALLCRSERKDFDARRAANTVELVVDRDVAAGSSFMALTACGHGLLKSPLNGAATRLP